MKQQTPDTTPTPRTDALKKKHTAHGSWAQSNASMEDMLEAHLKLERELTEKTNEVARLRELLNRAEHSAKLWEMDALRYHQNEMC